MDDNRDLAARSGYYSIPTGNAYYNIYSLEDQDEKTEALEYLTRAENLTIKQLSKILTDLRASFIVKELQGQKLLPREETLKDFDILFFAAVALATWTEDRKPTGK